MIYNPAMEMVNTNIKSYLSQFCNRPVFFFANIPASILTQSSKLAALHICLQSLSELS